jgi:Trk K+ transport system NAD-binding subunit
VGNPLLYVPPLLRRRSSLRRAAVDIPTQVPSTDAVFLVLRRMRAPLLTLIGVFTLSVVGLSLAPGVDSDGSPHRLSVFESFYFMSYTATTIGFGEIPYAFTTQQRLWVTFSIYATVVGWAYTVGTLLALFQDAGFRDAIAAQRFRRRVRRIDSPFHILTGYGQAGHQVALGLDALGRRVVVVERDGHRVDVLATEPVVNEVPGVEADARNPAVLGLAGLGHRHCAGVLALTDADDVNLAVVQAVNLLRPEIPVIARCSDRMVQARMEDFGAGAVINPLDRFGTYLVLGLRRPATFQLVSWVMSPPRTPLPDRGSGVPSGLWVVSAEGRFRDEVARDLSAAGYEVTFADPKEVEPDVTGAVGFVAGTSSDSTNLALAAAVRRTAPGVRLCLRQGHSTAAPLLAAFAPEIVFVPTDLVARECLARIVTPLTWSFIEHALVQDDSWGEALLDELVTRCGSRTPEMSRLELTPTSAPAVARWLGRGELSIGDLVRHPDDRTESVSAVVLSVRRGDSVTFVPDADEPLEMGDELLVASRPRAHGALRDVLFHDDAVEYVATGRRVPSTWVWRKLARRRH